MTTSNTLSGDLGLHTPVVEEKEKPKWSDTKAFELCSEVVVGDYVVWADASSPRGYSVGRAVSRPCGGEYIEPKRSDDDTMANAGAKRKQSMGMEVVQFEPLMGFSEKDWFETKQDGGEKPTLHIASTKLVETKIRLSRPSFRVQVAQGVLTWGINGDL